jgi:hypothetical protein
LKIGFAASVPEGLSPNQRFLLFAGRVLTPSKEVRSLAAFGFSLLTVFPRRQNPLACFLNGPFLYLANLHTLFSADSGTFSAAGSLFGAINHPWPTVEALCDDLVAAGFDDVTPELVEASAAWRLASAHLAVARPAITWARVDASEGVDESQDANASETSESEAESDDESPTTTPPGAAAEPPSAKKTRGNGAAPDGMSLCFFCVFFLCFLTELRTGCLTQTMSSSRRCPRPARVTVSGGKTQVPRRRNCCADFSCFCWSGHGRRGGS